MASPPWAGKRGPPGVAAPGFLRQAGGTNKAPRPRASGAGAEALGYLESLGMDTEGLTIAEAFE